MKGEIVILDSSQIYIDTFCRLLYEIGVFTTVTARTYEQFLMREINLEKAAVILLDIAFPTQTEGLHVLKRIRANPKLQTVPVIIVTEMRQSDIREDLTSYAIAHFIEKPFKPELLLSAVNMLLIHEEKEEVPAHDFSNAPIVRLSANDYIEREIQVAARLNSPLSLIVISPKNTVKKAVVSVKEFEESCPLPQVVRDTVQKNLRSIDQVFLNENQEILAVLPATDAEGAEKALEKIISEVKEHLPTQELPNCSDYYGVAVSYPKEGKTLDELMQSAFAMINSKKELDKISSRLNKRMANSSFVYRKTRKYC